VALVKRRPAVLFSEFDLVASGAGIANYHALGNLVTYLTLK
jgi:hypothetical protein